jgi:hypothetical protein
VKSEIQDYPENWENSDEAAWFYCGSHKFEPGRIWIEVAPPNEAGHSHVTVPLQLEDANIHPAFTASIVSTFPGNRFHGCNLT